MGELASVQGKVLSGVTTIRSSKMPSSALHHSLASNRVQNLVERVMYWAKAAHRFLLLNGRQRSWMMTWRFSKDAVEQAVGQCNNAFRTDCLGTRMMSIS